MYKALIFLVLAAATTVAQSDVQKMVDAEHAFAALAAEKGTKTAFLATMADGAVVFGPEKVDARTNWMSKGESKGLLAWAPNYADIASDGSIGYTTGNWEFRPKGKDDAPVAFGDFITIWKRQPDKNYKWVIDIGTSHNKPNSFSTEWKMTAVARDKVANRSDLNGAVKDFSMVAAKSGLAEAYKQYAGDDIRVYRQSKMPILGKIAATAEADSDKRPLSISFVAGPTAASDLAYFLTEYSRITKDAVLEKGYVLQIWKLYRGQWHLELDIFNPVPAK